VASFVLLPEPNANLLFHECPIGLHEQFFFTKKLQKHPDFIEVYPGHIHSLLGHGRQERSGAACQELRPQRHEAGFTHARLEALTIRTSP
jgi:hypothetical protein